MFESGISQRKLIICRAPSLSRNRRSAPFVFVFTGDNSVLSLTFCLLTPKLQLLSSVLLPGRPVAQTPARRSCGGSRPRLLSFDLARCAVWARLRPWPPPTCHRFPLSLEVRWGHNMLCPACPPGPRLSFLAQRRISLPPCLLMFPVPASLDEASNLTSHLLLLTSAL